MKFKSSEESTKELMEIKSPTEDENTTDWFDKNKFKKILAIFHSNKFNHKNKIGEFKYNGIKDLVNNINKKAISEILARKHLNELNEIKNAEIKNKRLISKQKELLDLFNNYFIQFQLRMKTVIILLIIAIIIVIIMRMRI